MTVGSSGGGGASAFETELGYQNGYCGTTTSVNTCGGKRGTPDVARDADPNTGVAVYDSTAYQGQKGWWVVGRTSLGAPRVAGVVALCLSVGCDLIKLRYRQPRYHVGVEWASLVHRWYRL